MFPLRTEYAADGLYLQPVDGMTSDDGSAEYEDDSNADVTQH